MNRESIELPSGRIEGYATELTIRTLGRLDTPEEFNNLIIQEQERTGDPVAGYRLCCLLPPRMNERSCAETAGIPMVGVAVTPQPGSNYIDIADEVTSGWIRYKKTSLPTSM